MNDDQVPSLDIGKLKVLSPLGRGAKGVVFLVQNEAFNGELLALKVISRASIKKKAKKNNESNGNEYKRVLFEQEVLRRFQHPLLPKLRGVLSTQNVVCYAIDYCPGRDLNHLRKKQTEKMFSDDLIRSLMDSKLSKDIIIEIISRTSLSTFDAMRCTSKEINKMMYGSNLLDLYKQRNNIISGLITQSNPMSDTEGYIRVFAPSPESKSLDLSIVPDDAHIRASSEHGIIVFERPHLQFYVCKPATKQLMQLPHPKTKNETYIVSIVIMDSNPLRYKIFRFSEPRDPPFDFHFRSTYCCEVVDSSAYEMEWRLIDPIKLPQKFPYVTLLDKQAITIGGSIYILLTDHDILKFDAYLEKWTSTFTQPKVTLDFMVYTYRRLIKYEGKLGLAVNRRDGNCEIWLLTTNESWEKTYVLNDTKRPVFLALYDSDTSIMLDVCEVLYYRFKSDDKSENRTYMSSTRFSVLPNATFIFRSDLNVIDLVS